MCVCTYIHMDYIIPNHLWASAHSLYQVLKSAPLLWHTVYVIIIDLLQDVEVLWPTVPVHKDKVLLFLDDTGKQFKQSTYMYKGYTTFA